MFEEEALNHKDWISCEKEYLHEKITPFGEKDKAVLLNVIRKLGENFNHVLEIGVGKTGEYSSTHFILKEKAEAAKYLGIDIDPQSTDKVNAWGFPNSHTLLVNSLEFETVRAELEKLGMLPLDFLLIDGNHSTFHIYDDFRYVSLVKKGGYVLMHDTNYHPGSSLILHCIDTDLFEMEKFYEGEEDWGVTTLKKL
jgi:hypothetical protein